MSYTNCYFGNEGWEASGNGALLRTQVKLWLAIITMSKSEASDKINMDKRKLNVSKSHERRYSSLEITVVFKL